MLVAQPQGGCSFSDSSETLKPCGSIRAASGFCPGRRGFWLARRSFLGRMNILQTSYIQSRFGAQHLQGAHLGSPYSQMSILGVCDDLRVAVDTPKLPWYKGSTIE